jgi:hypothetical protein
MKKSIAVALTIVVATALAASLAAADNGAEVIVINQIQKKFPPVSFKHHAHQSHEGIQCADCHHTAKTGEAVKACSSCHGQANGAPEYKTAMHKNCQGCHKKMATGAKSAPTKCTGCHQKDLAAR